MASRSGPLVPAGLRWLGTVMKGPGAMAGERGVVAVGREGAARSGGSKRARVERRVRGAGGRVRGARRAEAGYLYGSPASIDGPALALPRGALWPSLHADLVSGARRGRSRRAPAEIAGAGREARASPASASRLSAAASAPLPARRAAGPPSHEPCNLMLSAVRSSCARLRSSGVSMPRAFSLGPERSVTA
jgi:hypothetical protein